MPAHRVLHDMELAENTVPDPGDAGTIEQRYWNGQCELTSGTSAETRTLARSSRVGSRIALAFKTDGGGNITVTVTGNYSENGDSTIVFTTAGQVVVLESFQNGANVDWRVVRGLAGAALTAEDASTVDATYGTEERDVINNLRTRLGEVEGIMQKWGMTL